MTHLVNPMFRHCHRCVVQTLEQASLVCGNFRAEATCSTAPGRARAPLWASVTQTSPGRQRSSQRCRRFPQTSARTQCWSWTCLQSEWRNTFSRSREMDSRHASTTVKHIRVFAAVTVKTWKPGCWGGEQKSKFCRYQTRPRRLVAKVEIKTIQAEEHSFSTPCGQ